MTDLNDALIGLPPGLNLAVTQTKHYFAALENFQRTFAFKQGDQVLLLTDPLLDVRVTDAIMGLAKARGAVVRQFVIEGIHHIFIGPDHILFIIGLLLLGGGMGQLLKIVTAFTVAHSITLGLATFGVLNPPARIVEPAIALSIVFVGVHAFSGRKQRDPRLVFAFCFGFIHGFGFASVLREAVLPGYALGWSLFAFNGGVEIGQAGIVITVAPLLALLRQFRPHAAERIVAAGALCVTTAGAFWFFQRIME